MTATLVVQAAGAEAQDVVLDKPVVIVGRDRECDLVLDYDQIRIAPVSS